ncbi:alpha/beta fold hydrolase [Arthrobacter sulfonylureivorans]|uniref:alpha/beta fold hydrolase n=1 Tax=Arthrobacter sulfonylureivorans TaxID=2486855 RepID=UPI0039E2F26E
MVNLPDELTLPGVVLRYADRPGDGPAVVFLHGAGADHVMFEAQAAALAERGQRVVLLDLRGQGQSQPNTAPLTAELFVQDVEALLTTLGLDRPVLAGHSLGGNIAQALVRRNPGKYAGLIVMDSTWNAGPLTSGERFLLRLAAPALALIPARRLPKLMAKASTVTDAGRADAERAFSQVSKRGFIDVWRATVQFVAPDPGYRTPVPLLLIRGAEDKTGNIATAMPAWAAAENVPEHVIGGAGHLVTQDAPTAVTEAIIKFLAGETD